MNRKKNLSKRYKYIRLSYTLNSNSPLHPDLQKPQITPQNQILTGDNKQDISYLLSKKDLIEDIDCLFLRTGFGTYHDENPEKYSTQNPGISPEAVFHLRCQLPNLACLGIDSISMSRYGRMKESIEVHKNAFMKEVNLGKPLVLVEDLDLRVVGEKTELEKVLVVPWQVGNIDSAPCTVLAQITQY